MLRLADYQLRARTGARVSSSVQPVPAIPRARRPLRADPGDELLLGPMVPAVVPSGICPLALREIDRSIRQLAQRRCEVRPPRLNANCTSRIDGRIDRRINDRRIEHQQARRRACAAASRSAAMAAMPITARGQGWQDRGRAAHRTLAAANALRECRPLDQCGNPALARRHSGRTGALAAQQPRTHPPRGMRPRTRSPCGVIPIV